MKKQGQIFIGTSGWNYKHWIGTFYPVDTKTGDQLSFYTKQFKTVELNNPFYHLPSPQTFANWRKIVCNGKNKEKMFMYILITSN